MRACLLATRLAERMRVGTDTLSDVYYTTLLRYIGCTAYAHEEAVMAGGDEIAARAWTTSADSGSLPELLSTYVVKVGGSAVPLRRPRVMVTSLPRMLMTVKGLVASHCEVGFTMARRLEMRPAVQDALLQIFERWDGKGFPRKLVGDDLCVPVRFAHVATQVVAFMEMYDIDAACVMVGKRAGGFFDPAICSAFQQHGPSLLSDIESADAWQAAVTAEPEPQRTIPEPHIDDVARSFADMVDLKTSWTHGHSTRVADLAEGAAAALHMEDEDVVALRRAALFHDLGRVAVPNGIWEKPGSLTTAEWERVRLHPYHTERILERSPRLASLAQAAGMHHERQDGSGYYRRAAGMTLPFAARVLAAADVYAGMTQDRPYRPAFTAAATADALRLEARAGRLDGEAVRAVLLAAGHQSRRKRGSWPAGLSDREVEVLRLIARGASHRDVARTLTISPRTAAHHIQHIYDKIGVSTRAAAAMFAMEHDLIH